MIAFSRFFKQLIKSTSVVAPLLATTLVLAQTNTKPEATPNMEN